MSRLKTWTCAVAMLVAGPCAWAGSPANAAAPGTVMRMTETIVRQEADGSVVTVVRPVKDIAEYFRQLGAPVPPTAPAQSECPDSAVTPGAGVEVSGPAGSGHGGLGGDVHVPSGQDAATAATLMPPVTIAADSNVSSYTGSMTFFDGWSVTITWRRSPGIPVGPWFRTNLGWTPPDENRSEGGSTQADCGDMRQ